MTKLEYLKNKYYRKWYNNYPQDLKNMGGDFDIDSWWSRNIHFYQSKYYTFVDSEFRELLDEWKAPSLFDFDD